MQLATFGPSGNSFSQGPKRRFHIAVWRMLITRCIFMTIARPSLSYLSHTEIILQKIIRPARLSGKKSAASFYRDRFDRGDLEFVTEAIPLTRRELWAFGCLVP
jgi:hypothetical protein